MKDKNACPMVVQTFWPVTFNGQLDSASLIGNGQLPGLQRDVMITGSNKFDFANSPTRLDMFTGLIEGLGTVLALETEPSGLKIVLKPIFPVSSSVSGESPACGDSIAINGCCLTVVAIGDGQLSFQAGAETLSKTNLGRLKTGDFVNLERALPVNGRLGGHFVQGHVDGIGTIDQLDRDTEWVTMGFRVAPSLAELMVAKGSVAVDGISLTIVTVDADRFTVALIPHTLSVTTLGQRAIGQTVNIETDILGKYARKFLMGQTPSASPS